MAATEARRATRVLRCPNRTCRQAVRVPADRGAGVVTCPTCRARWAWSPSPWRDRLRATLRAWATWVTTHRLVAAAVAVAVVVACLVVFRPAEPPTEVDGLAATLRDALPDGKEAVAAWLRQPELYPWPMTDGDDEGDLRQLAGAGVVSDVTGLGPASWTPSVVAPGGPLRVWPTDPAGEEAVRRGAVRIDRGRAVIDGPAFPDDGRFHAFVLAAEPPVRTAPIERELLCLRRRAGRPASSPPGRVAQGYVLEGWAQALEQGWSDDGMRALIYLGNGQMALLSRQAMAGLESCLTDGGNRFLLGDLARLPGSWDARRTAVLSRLTSR